MSKKNAIILILLIFTLILSGLLFLYFFNNSNKETNPPAQTPENINQNPFGKNATNKTSSTTNNKPDNNYTDKSKNQTLRKLYSEPVSGSTLLEGVGTTKVRLVDRATGNVYETSENSEEIVRITNTLVPKVLEAIWGSNENSLILRYSMDNSEKIINSLSKIKISSSTSNAFVGQMQGQVVHQNAESIVINPTGDKSFGLVKEKDLGGSYGIVSSLDGLNKRQIFDSDISEWLISWPKDNIISFVTKPSYIQDGYLFFLDINTGLFTKVFGGERGMNVLVNRDATAFVYSSSIRNSFELSYYDIKTSTNKNLQVTTVADKCVWGNKNKKVVYCAIPKYILSNSYPDSWYQGITSFEDNFWRIDTEKGTTELLYETGVGDSISVDAIDFKINKDDSYLTFINKFDLSLWGLKILK